MGGQIWAERKAFPPSPGPRLSASAPLPQRQSALGPPCPGPPFRGAGSARNPWARPAPVGPRPAVLPALGGPSVPKVPGSCKNPTLQLRPWLVALSPRGTALERVWGSPCAWMQKQGARPPSPKGPDLDPLPSTGIGRGGDPPRRPFKRPEGDRDLGPGWRAPGRGEGRQPPGRLRLGPHVTAPRARKGRENLPLPPPPAQIHLRRGWGR